MRLKIYAKNSKGRSEYVWLRAQTTRPEVHLVQNQDFLGSSSDFGDYSRFYSMFRSSLSLTFLAIITVITMTVITLAIIVLASRRRAMSLTTSSSCHFDESGPSGPASRDSCDQLHQTTDDVLKRAAGSFLRPDVHLEEKKCTCDDEFCDEQLLSSGQQFTNPYQGRDYGWEGPPDIILYFPYNTATAATDATSDPTSSYALSEGSLLDKNYSSAPFGMLSGHMCVCCVYVLLPLSPSNRLLLFRLYHRLRSDCHSIRRTEPSRHRYLRRDCSHQFP